MRAAAIVWSAILLTTCFIIVTATSRITVAQTGNSPAAVESKSAEPTATTPPRPDYTTKRQFGFPVTIDPAAIGVASLQLHYSTDRGRSWKLYAEQPADIKSFPVRATGDGEFWFAVKTVDIGNNMRPAGETTVQRIVIIDSRKPKIDLSAETLADGQIRMRWRISDRHLDLNSLKFGYQSGKAQWQTLSLDDNNREVSEGVFGGEYTWKPQTSSRVVNLRIEVADLARNGSAEARQLFLPRIAKSRAVAEAVAQPNVKTDAAISKPDKTTPADSVPTPPPVQPAVSWPINNQLPLQNESANNNPATDDGYGRLASQVNPPVQDQASPDNETPIDTPVETDESTASEPSADSSSPTESESRWPKIPTGEPLRMTQSRRFQLDYDIESLGPDVVSEVQLWGTEDGGQTWGKWNIDHDRQSPFDVQVNEEGLYGFRVVIIANNGLAGEVPDHPAPCHDLLELHRLAPPALTPGARRWMRTIDGLRASGRA
jgi:hypothetical protein